MESDVMGKLKTIHQRTEENREDFDYYWQHLRLSFGYCTGSAGVWWNSNVATHSSRGSRSHAVHHLWRQFESCFLLPTPVAAGIEDSVEALREVLKKNPDFFETAQCQTIGAKASTAEDPRPPKSKSFWPLAWSQASLAHNCLKLRRV